MKTHNKLFTILILSFNASAAIAAINKCLQISATSNNILTNNDSHCYHWRLGNIYYTKTGFGKPLLLIHNLSAASGGFEWKQTIELLKKHFTIYTIDLLGCGRSEKPYMTYTNYLYVQLINDFIKSVIGHRTSVIASGDSASIPLMACSSDPDLFDQILLVNPLKLIDYTLIPGKSSKLFKFLIDTPIFGTLLYNIALSRPVITKQMKHHAFYNPFRIQPHLIDLYYESAHLGGCKKAVFTSQKCNYTKCNIMNALKKIDNSIYLVGGNEIKNIHERLEEYKEFNPAIEISYIPKTKYLPQHEEPVKLSEIIITYLS